MTEPACTCDPAGLMNICFDHRNEPHFAGCPRWGTPRHSYDGGDWRGGDGVRKTFDVQRWTFEDQPTVPQRPDWDGWGLSLARTVSARADCTRRRVGAVILDAEHRVVATGYNGAPAGQPGCLTDGACPRGQLSLAEQPGMVGYDRPDARCDALHAEMNAVIYAGRDRAAGGTLYCTDEPCHMCSLVIAAAGIARVVVA